MWYVCKTKTAHEGITSYLYTHFKIMSVLWGDRKPSYLQAIQIRKFVYLNILHIDMYTCENVSLIMRSFQIIIVKS